MYSSLISMYFLKAWLYHACIFLITHVFLSPGFIAHVFFFDIHVYVDTYTRPNN